MTGAIFLSAGIPDPSRDPARASTADPIAIASAVASLVHVVIGRRVLVWGGHPTITPMIAAFADSYGIEFSKWVHLFQSQFFEAEFPEDNDLYERVTVVEASGDRQASLARMRTSMLSAYKFDAAVFVGGMEGILDEWKLFCELNPASSVVAIASAGGAAAEIPGAMIHRERELAYASFLHEQLRVPTAERRYRNPDEQPNDMDARLIRNDR